MFHHTIDLETAVELQGELQGVEKHKGVPAFITGRHDDLGMVIIVNDPFKSSALLVSQHDPIRFIDEGA